MPRVLRLHDATAGAVCKRCCLIKHNGCCVGRPYLRAGELQCSLSRTALATHSCKSAAAHVMYLCLLLVLCTHFHSHSSRNYPSACRLCSSLQRQPSGSVAATGWCSCNSNSRGAAQQTSWHCSTPSRLDQGQAGREVGVLVSRQQLSQQLRSGPACAPGWGWTGLDWVRSVCVF